MSASAEPQGPEFVIQRIYVKDVSFEAPNTPQIFQQEWKPEVNFELNTDTTRLDDNNHEVVLSLTVTVKSDDKVAFIVEVKHAGIFTINGLEDQQLHETLGSFCPNIIYPYAREAISDMVVRGGFPQLNLAPVNFDALYAQHLEQAEASES